MYPETDHAQNNMAPTPQDRWADHGRGPIPADLKGSPSLYQLQGMRSTKKNHSVPVALSLLLGLLLMDGSKDRPEAVLGQNSTEDPLKWPRRLGWTILGIYGLNKLLEYLDTIPVQISAPTPPVQPSVDWTALLGNLVTDAAVPASEEPRTIWTPPRDDRWLTLAPQPSVALVLGKRGSGKTALGYRLLEMNRDRAAPYVVGVPAAVRKLLPEWIGVMDRLDDVPEASVVLLDEAYIQFHARNAMSREGREIGTMVNLSRQRRQSLIFIVHEARQLDVNAISQADVIAIKELSEISREFERRELKAFTDKARIAFLTVRGDKRLWTWVFSETSGEVGLVVNALPSFWTPRLSRAFAESQQSHSTSSPQRKGQRTSTPDLAAKAKSMRRVGFSYGAIADKLNVSKSYAFKLVKGSE